MMPPNAAPRAYSYLRFSTPEQSKGDSLRRQTALAEEYAKQHGLTLDSELRLRDLGVSAFRGDNAAVGALGAFLQAIRDGLVPKGSLLLVEALDRISRKQARKAVRILEEVLEGGVDVVTLNDGKRWTEESLDGADFLLAILLFMRGNEESATKAKRLKAAWVGKRERAARGEIQSTRVPAWLRAEGSAAKDTRDAKLSLIPERAKLVRRMFSLFLGGLGKKAIAEQFNEERVPTWGAGKGRNRAQFWHGSYVLKILTNPAVTGRFVPHIEEHRDGKMHRVPQQPVADYYPRVIDDETFQRVQTLIGARRATVRGSRVASLVAGLAKCPSCGSTMTRVTKGNPKKAGPPKLVCTRAKAGAGCKYLAVRLADVERAIIGHAAELGNPPAADADLDANLAGLSGEVSELEAEIEAIVDSIERSPSPALSKRLAKRESELERVRVAYADLQRRAADSESRVVRHRSTRLRDALKQLAKDPHQLASANAALRECVDSIVVQHATGQLILHWRHGVTSSLLYTWPGGA